MLIVLILEAIVGILLVIGLSLFSELAYRVNKTKSDEIEKFFEETQGSSDIDIIRRRIIGFPYHLIISLRISKLYERYSKKRR